MSLVAGTCLGLCEIQSALGAGGMGGVCRARDTRLDRTITIKVLRADVSSDPERRARFEREARAIAALAHPRLYTLCDIGTHDGTTHLVMAHLAGESLAEPLGRGADRRRPRRPPLTVCRESSALAAFCRAPAPRPHV